MKPPSGKPRRITLLALQSKSLSKSVSKSKQYGTLAIKAVRLQPIDSLCCAAHKKANDLSGQPEIDSDTDFDEMNV